MARFSREKIERHIRKHHPGCPEFAVIYIAERVAERHWWDLTPGAAVAITIRSELRHKMTEYERLLGEGVSREDARNKVQWKVDRMLAEWNKKPAG